MKFTLSLVFIQLCLLSFSQDLHLKSGTYHLADYNDLRQSWNTVDNEYVIIQFYATPSVEEKQTLEAVGVELFDYLPRHAFLARIDKSIDVNSSAFSPVERVVAIENDFKLSKNLVENTIPGHAITNNTYVDLDCSYFPNIDTEVLRKQIAESNILAINTYSHTVTIRVKLDELENYYNIPELYFFQAIPEESQPENLIGRVSHRSNFLRSDMANGLFYRGEGVKVMMQDDGYIGDHIDYTGRIDQSMCGGCSTDDADNHGDHVAGTIMGAGNLDPKGRGMADGVDLLVFNSSNNNYNNVPSLYTNDSLVITSKSYSNGCNAGYTSLANQLDAQIRTMPSLTHVFSAGNSGSSDCGYGAGAGWANITGGHKAGKNVYAVGNLNQSDIIANSSSRGPAEDGRIKPDICAVGSGVYSTISDNTYDNFTGTSMSCPGVAGTIAQLYDAYRDDFGMNPLSGLIKGAILNTGEDLGNPGPDFIYGWGRINARRAYETFHNNQFLYDSVYQGTTNTHTINIPAGTKQLRVMVYWMDYEGSTSAAFALVNDINMSVEDPNTTTYNPWVLDPTPNATALSTPAVRGIDNLNNMEQVTIDDPVSGNYVVTVNGFDIPQGPQQYHLVYYFVRDQITVTYPNGGEPFEPSTGEVIRWDAKDNGVDYTLEYTEDDGATWNPIGVANNDRLFYNWSVPATLTGLARVRITRGALSDQSDEVFSIIDVPNNLDFSWACPDSAKLVWDAVPGATSYEVSMLGNKYMDSIGTSLTNEFTILQPSSDMNWYSVKAKGPDNATSERHIAIQKSGTEFACLWSTPGAAFTIDCDNGGTEYCVNFTNESVNANATSTYTWYFPNGTPATSNLENPTVCYANAGDYDVALVVDNGFDTDSVYFTNSVHVVPTLTLPYIEGFEGYTSFNNLDNWTIDNPDNNGTWEITNSAALTGSQSARILNHLQNGNYMDELISGPIDLTSVASTDAITLTFRYSYRKKTSANDEWLKFFITKNCSDDWVQRKTIHGDFLSNITTSTSWVPTTDEDWVTIHVTNITNTFYTGDFRFKFRFESDFGSNIYLDDINIYEGAPSDVLITNGLEETTFNDFTVYPNPADNDLFIQYSLNEGQQTAITITNVSGQTVLSNTVNSQSGNNVAIVDINTLTPGLYFVQLTNGSSSVTKKITIQ